MSDWANFIPLILIVLAFWFLVLRPARKRQKDFVATQQALAPGTRVMLASGIFGELVSVGDVEAELRIAPDVVVTVAKHAVAKVVEPTDISPDEQPVDRPHDED